MPYVLTVANREERDSVVAALRQAADQRSRVAAAAAGEVLAAEQEAKAAGRRDDLRPAALRVTRFLGEANTLATIADRFEQAPESTLEAKVDAEMTNGLAAPAVDAGELPLDPAPVVPGKVDTAAGIASAAANIDAAIEAKVADDGPTYDDGADTDDDNPGMGE